ncbi:hypothetical protein BDL97_04G060400 [Sphagnum fallax]|nr:hypothetical protein BDL97_04G060400 [Sphagnum fallax]
MAGKTSAPAAAHDAVLRTSATGEDHGDRVSGYDFNHGLDLQALLRSMYTTGFQASHLGQAVEEVNRMLDWRLSDEPIMETTSDEQKDLAFRKTVKCKIFLGCTSNIISSGVRETIRFLLEHRMVDVLVTTAGGVEEDLIKCLAPTFMGSFSMEGTQLRAKGLNRIGNLLVPNTNYCKFEDWVVPILDQLVAEQKEQGTLWTPSRMIARLGKEINHPDSICYWAQKNGIPIYCPAITDGSLGDMIYFHSFRNPGLVIDIVEGSLTHLILSHLLLN